MRTYQHVVLMGCFYLFILENSILSESLLIVNSKRDYVRVKRQDGYNYDRPSISFDLPTRPSTVATQAPTTTVDRAKSQQMYYAYPAPSGSEGDTVNIGYSGGTTGYSSGTTTGYSAGTATGYSAGVATTSPTSSSNVAVSDTSGVTGYNYGTQSPVKTDRPASGATSCTSGYNCNSSGSTGSSTASTNAPKYLPPTGVGADAAVSINVPSGPGPTAPPVRAAPPVTTQSITPTPDTNYLPPNQSPAPAPGPRPSPTPGSPAPSGYLPPVSTPGTTIPNTVSTPASTYLPPVL